MSIDVDSHQIVKSAIIDGLYVSPGFFDSDEVTAMRREVFAHEILARHVPRLTQLVDAVTDVMNGGDNPLRSDFQPIVGHSVDEVLPTSMDIRSHTDSTRGRFGLSLLIPLEGERADLYASEAPFVVPDDLERSRPPVTVTSYGPGDVAFLRQQIEVVDPNDMTVLERYNQISHVGVAAHPRILRSCDIVIDAIPDHVI